MIHTIFVDDTTEADALAKVFRKKLMIGGAVVKVQPGLSEPQQIEIFNRFFALGQKAISELVLRALAEYNGLTRGLIPNLITSGRRRVLASLLYHQDLSQAEVESINDLLDPAFRSQVLIKREYKQLQLLNPASLRRKFLASLPGSPSGEEVRVSLARIDTLPKDLEFLLRRDPSQAVRAQLQRS